MYVVALKLCLSLLIISSVYGRFLDTDLFEDHAFAARASRVS